ncbi:uncharacterized protein LOC144421096 [Styela clava]
MTTEPTLSTSPTTEMTTEPTLSTFPTTEMTTGPTLSTFPTTKTTTGPTLSTFPTTETTTGPTLSTFPTTEMTTGPTLSTFPTTEMKTGPSSFTPPTTNLTAEPTASHIADDTAKMCTFPTEFSDCASACQPTCDKPMPEICTLQCVSDPCVCAEGYIRKSDKNSTCVLKNECSKTCNDSKVVSQCAPSCPPTCIDPFPKCNTTNCSDDPCVCPEGYVLKSIDDDRCILRHECEGIYLDY